MLDKKLLEKLKSDPKFIPFNDKFDYEYVQTYLENNINNNFNLDLVSKALSTIFFIYYYISLKDFFYQTINKISIPKETVLEALINFSNRDLYLATAKTNEFIKQKKEIHIDRFSNVSFNSSIPELGSFNIQGGLEAGHDALNLTLNLLLNYQVEFDTSQLNAKNLSKLFKVLGFANIYTVIKFGYDSAIWDDYVINYEEESNELKIKCNNPESALIIRVGEHRLERNIFAAKMYVMSKYSEQGSFFKLLSTEFNRKRKPKKLKSVKITNNFLQFKLADGFDKNSIHIELMTYAELTTFYQFLGNEVLPNFKNLNLHDLITIFSEIQYLLQSALNLKKEESECISPQNSWTKKIKPD